MLLLNLTQCRLVYITYGEHVLNFKPRRMWIITAHIVKHEDDMIGDIGKHRQVCQHTPESHLMKKV